MNWARVKTAFIILLLVCNVVLFSINREAKSTVKPTGEEVLLENMISKISNEGIDLSDVNFKEVKNVPVLKVSEKDLDFDDEKYKYSMLGLEPFSIEKGKGYLFTYKADGVLDLQYYSAVNSGENDETNAPGDDSFETNLKIAESYLPDNRKNEIYKSDGSESNKNDLVSFKLKDYKKLGDGTYEIYFEQTYGEIRISDGFILMDIKDGKLMRLSQKIVSIEADREKTQNLIPYSLALYRLYSTVDKKDLPIKITEVNITQELSPEKKTENMVSGEAFPYYRFSSEKKGMYIINAIEVEWE